VLGLGRRLSLGVESPPPATDEELQELVQMLEDEDDEYYGFDNISCLLDVCQSSC